MISDLRLALRTLRRRPGYSLVVTAVFTLGLGGTVALFALVDAVLIQPLPLSAPERLVYGYGSFPLNDSASVSPPDFLDYRHRSESFEALAAHTRFPSTVGVFDGTRPESASATYVSRNYLDVLRLTPTHGRNFGLAPEEGGTDDEVLLSHGFWQRHYAGDTSAVGGTLRIEDREHTIVGVLPPTAPILGDVDLYMPLRFGQPEFSVRRFHFLGAIGRLKDGIGLAAAQQEVDAIAADLARIYPSSNDGWRLRLVPLKEVVVGAVRTPLSLLLAGISLVLLVACANVGALTLARSATRSGELALRRALGAGRGGLVRMLLAENLVLAVAGGASGLLLAAYLLDGVAALASETLPRLEEVSLDGRVLAFTLVTAVAAGAISAILPALRLGTANLQSRLDASRTTTSSPSRLRDGLVVAQVALSVVLLVSSSLLLRSLRELDRVDLGFSPASLLTAAVSLPESRYPTTPTQQGFFDALSSEIASLPEVEAVALADLVPFSGHNDTFLYPEDRPPEPPSAGFNTQVRRVGADYFSTLGVTLEAGREIQSSDGPGSPPVAVINSKLAKTLFPGRWPLTALGERLVIDVGEPVTVTVVGVVASLQEHSPGQPENKAIYLAQRQLTEGATRLLIRTRGEPSAVVPGLRDALRRLDPELPLAEIASLEEHLATLTAGPRFRTSLLSLFGVVALLLAAVGLYGLLAHHVAERRRELGLRQALGALPANLARLVVGRGMVLTALGLALGIPAALAAARLFDALLFGVEAGDPASFLAAAVLVALVALVSCLLPALRASRVEPMAALRLN